MLHVYVVVVVVTSSMSPGAYYLAGELGMRERALTRWASQHARSLGLTQISTPDLLKDLILVKHHIITRRMKDRITYYLQPTFSEFDFTCING